MTIPHWRLKSKDGLPANVEKGKDKPNVDFLVLRFGRIHRVRWGSYYGQWGSNGYEWVWQEDDRWLPLLDLINLPGGK